MLGNMPGYLAEPECFGVKLVSLIPRNKPPQYSSHLGVVLLFEAEHGQPVALLDAAEITALRTAAAQLLAERAHAERAETVAAACSAHPETKLLSGSLATQRAGATFQLKVTVCGNVTLWDQRASARGHADQAAHKAVTDAVDTYLSAAAPRG